MTDADAAPTPAEPHGVIELRSVSKHYGTRSGQPVAADDNV